MYENGMSPADVAAVMNHNNGYNDGMGFGGGAWWWIIILFLFGMNGGWGFGNGANGTGSEVQRGFDQNAVMNGISGLGNGISGIQTSLCNGFAGVTAAVNNGFASAEVAANARQMADMQQNFALQTGLGNQLNAIAMNQQNCCCENRAAVADLKYTVATEACADRAAVSDALNAVLNTMNAQVQSIKDQMCQDKIDAKNEKIAELQNQLTMANLEASQNAKTAAILANNEAQTAALEQYLAPVPRPAYIVQNPSCCNPNFACGCNG